MKRNIALLTDFGTEDGYVGAMKGKILTIAPEADVIDISHEIKPFNTRQAAFCLFSCYSFFPAKTIFTVVVDPGVGTQRKGLVLQSTNYSFIGPDNGAFSLIYEKEAPTVFEINTNSIPWKIAPTFHGRDIFAPLAAFIASGKGIDDFIAPTKKFISFIKPIRKVENKRLRIPVAHIDHFGNVILNLNKENYSELVETQSGGVPSKEVRISYKDFQLKNIRNTFGEVDEGELLLVWDSSDYLQIAKNGGSAAEALDINVENEVEMTL